jgi:hypothetical protein
MYKSKPSRTADKGLSSSFGAEFNLTPWLLVRERTKPTERRLPIDEL